MVPVDGAIAYFKPGKKVQAFKYKQNGGRWVVVLVAGRHNEHSGWVSKFYRTL
jgi:hypothetical protein